MTVNEDICTHPTPQHLAAWLHARHIDTTMWGCGGAKSVTDLWHELQHGESTLTDDPPLRCLQVVEVIIRRDYHLLVETEQHFADGRIRLRNRPPSEKMQPSESPETAACRCIQEELAIAPEMITFPEQTIASRIEHDESASYPNLPSEYIFHRVEVQVTDLPNTPFLTPNAAHSDGDPIIAHRWAWVPASQVLP